MAVTWAGNRVRCALILLFLIGSVEAVPQVVLVVAFLLVAPQAGVVLTLGVLENVRLKHSMFSLSSYHRRYDRGEAGFPFRVLEFFLYRSFVYSPVRFGDVIKGFTRQSLLLPVRWNCGSVW